MEVVSTLLKMKGDANATDVVSWETSQMFGNVLIIHIYF